MMGWKERTLEEVRAFVGNGVRRLMEKAVPKGVSETDFERCFQYFQQHYLVHCRDNSCPYAGVEDMLRCIHDKGYSTAIVSNKLQEGVDELYETYFRNVVDVAIGEREGIRRKPSSDMVNLALTHLKVDRSQVIYVGDSEVDIATAANAGLPCISVLWGFRNQAVLENAGADIFVATPDRLLDKILKMQSE